MSWWPFKTKTKVPVPIVPESVKPPDSVIDTILSDSLVGSIAWQWVNWAAEEIGMPTKYHIEHPITVQSLWVLYEACRRHKEKENESK